MFQFCTCHVVSKLHALIKSFKFFQTNFVRPVNSSGLGTTFFLTKVSPRRAANGSGWNFMDNPLELDFKRVWFWRPQIHGHRMFYSITLWPEFRVQRRIPRARDKDRTSNKDKSRGHEGTWIEKFSDNWTWYCQKAIRNATTCNTGSQCTVPRVCGNPTYKQLQNAWQRCGNWTAL